LYQSQKIIQYALEYWHIGISSLVLLNTPKPKITDKTCYNRTATKRRQAILVAAQKQNTISEN